MRGVLWSEEGRAFAEILRGFTGRRLQVPPKGWKTAGIVIGERGKYSVAWRLLDSQFTTVAGYARALPQHRERLWLVGHRGDWTAPAEILIGFASKPPVPLPLRLSADTDTAADAGSTRNPICVAGNVVGRAHDNQFIRRQKAWSTGVSCCLTARQPNYICDDTGFRRMTPVEYERLMGFPDGYTAVPFNGKPAGDTTRMYALGNSWPLNCTEFVLGRIDSHTKGTLQ